jgi:glycosyltransferase involved in cell wall biosynthesis
MNILLVHQNFPGQFKHLAPALQKAGHRVVAFSMRSGQPPELPPGMDIHHSKPRCGSAAGLHPWVVDFEAKVIRGEATFRTAMNLRKSGFNPDVIVAHPGWGESLFLKEVWPKAKLGIYCEFFYQADGADTGFDPEFPIKDPEGDACRLQLKNVNNYLHFAVADAGLSPTQWQASTFPQPFRSRISVIHDGIDTRVVKPDPAVQMGLASVGQLTRKQEIITFVNRNLEPYRGYHVFMRTLPELLRRRPKAHVLVVGGDSVSYGAAPEKGKTWRDIYLAEVKDRFAPGDLQRVHFLGNIPYGQFLGLLQLSTVHLYLTYPFVLSWSLLEAMSAGCAIVASDTQPLREAVVHGETGRLVPFFDQARIADEICALLDNPAERNRLGAAARQHAVEHYDLMTRCLPRQMAWVQNLASLAP